MRDTDRPYALVARDYLAAGWAPLPLPAGKKFPPPPGYTGAGGRWPTAERVTAWRKDPRSGNVGLRMPDGVVGADVDIYEEKRGDETLAALERRLGPLPATWVSTARDAPSGIRFFRVPLGVRWKGAAGPSIDIISHGYRYAVAWPSIHPDTGTEYTWTLPDGTPAEGAVPCVGELPELPWAWVDDLTGAEETAEDYPEADTTEPTADELAKAQAVLSKAVREVEESPNGRNNTVAQWMLLLYRLAKGGCLDREDVEEQLWDASQRADGPGTYARTEFRATAKGAWKDARPARPWVERPEDAFPDDAEADHPLFEATPVLQHIKHAAQARLMAPYALLGCVLARVVSEVPPRVVLPPIIGSSASLNMAVGLVGGSGSGKSGTVALAHEVLLGEYGRARALPLGLGSGEGLIDSFLETVPDPYDPSGRRKIKQLRQEPHALLNVDEIGRLEAIQGRSGSSMAPVLRSALTGGDLTTSNADTDRRRHVPAQSYRLAVIAGIQPELSGVLLNDHAAGTPQRWLWMPVVDPSVPDVEPEWPGSLDWQPPPEFSGGHARAEVGVPTEVAQMLKEERRQQLRTGEFGEEGHRSLTRLKVAAALALLHGETAISLQWWGAAGHVMTVSDREKQRCLAALAKQHAARAVAQGRYDHTRARAAEDAATAEEAARVEGAAKTLRRLVASHAESAERVNNRKHAQDAGCTPRCLSFALRNHRRRGDEFATASRELAEDRDWLQVRDGRWFPGSSRPAEDGAAS